MKENADTIESSVRARYAGAASTVEPALCCPDAGYDKAALAKVPREIVDVDYGCGNPTRWVKPGDAVLDLGSGSGKNCYLAAQAVGSSGSVIGVDFNPPMLALARKHQAEFAQRIGFDNMTFKKGRIQDLALDLEALEAWLVKNPVSSADDYLAMSEHIADLRAHHPMIAANSVDCILSNCVLNLVTNQDRRQLFSEMYRVLNRGGRCVISDIVSDEDVPAALQRDADLWSGCISGAFQEEKFLEAFEQAGFHGIEIVSRSADPWQTVEGIEFRSLTVRAYKGKQGACIDHNQAVIYKGPWKSVTDDDGHTLHRGQPMAVCDKTFHLYTREPYTDSIVSILPRVDVPADAARPFDSTRDIRRSPHETKGDTYATTASADSCTPGGDCC